MFKRFCCCFVSKDNRDCEEQSVPKPNKIRPQSVKLNESFTPLNDNCKNVWFKSSQIKDDSVKTKANEKVVVIESKNAIKKSTKKQAESEERSVFKFPQNKDIEEFNNTATNQSVSSPSKNEYKTFRKTMTETNQSDKSFIRIEQHNSFNINLPNGNQEKSDLTINITTKQKNIKQSNNIKHKTKKSKNIINVNNSGILKKQIKKSSFISTTSLDQHFSNDDYKDTSINIQNPQMKNTEIVVEDLINTNQNNSNSSIMIKRAIPTCHEVKSFSCKEKYDSVDGINNSLKKIQGKNDRPETLCKIQNMANESNKFESTPKFESQNSLCNLVKIRDGINKSLSVRDIKTIIKNERKYSAECNQVLENNLENKLNKSSSLDISNISNSPCHMNQNKTDCLDNKEFVSKLSVDVRKNDMTGHIDSLKNIRTMNYTINDEYIKNDSPIFTPLTKGSPSDILSGKKKSSLKKSSQYNSQHRMALDSMSSKSESKTVKIGASNVAVVENYKDANLLIESERKIDKRVINNFVQKLKDRTKFTNHSNNVNQTRSHSIEILSKGIFGIVRKLQQKAQDLPEIAEESKDAEESMMKKKKDKKDKEKPNTFKTKKQDRKQYDLTKE